MPTVTFPVLGNDDDAYEHQDSTGFDAGDDLVAAISNNVSSSSRQDVGLRFDNITIPQGTVISAAVLRIFIEAGDNFDDAREHIFAEAIDDSPDFAATPSVMSRANSTANVAWSASNIGTGSYFPSPDITAVVQEILNRAGWASGNALTLLLRGDASGTSRTLRFMAKEHLDNNPALLDITYDFDATHLRYFGTGHMLYIDSATVPEVSSDYGVTFTSATAPAGGTGGPYTKCKAVTVDPAFERVWGLWTNAAETNAAIAFSTDFGATWTISTTASASQITDIACHPADTSRIAGVGAVSTDATVWVTQDRGATWDVRTGPALTNTISYQPISTGSSAYITQTPYGRLLISTGGRLADADGDLYWSDDLGVSWTKATVPSPAPNRNWNVQLFRVTGFGPYFMLYGDEASGAALSALLRSDDHGASWVNVLTPNTTETFAGLEYDIFTDTLLLSTPTHVYGLNPAASDDPDDWSDLTANFYTIALSGEYVFQPFAFVGDPTND